MLRSILTTVVLSVCSLVMAQSAHADDVFRLKSDLAGVHPRILFTHDEATALWAKATTHPDFALDRMLMYRNCGTYKHTGDASSGAAGQYVWWYGVNSAMYAAMSREAGYIDIAHDWWFYLTWSANWQLDAEQSFSLTASHYVAAYALIYDCLYNDLTEAERDLSKDKIINAIKKIHDRGYEGGITGAGAYWLNDYQNNHMHFRLTASLFSLISIWGEITEDMSLYADNIIKYYRRLDYVVAKDGSNHEGFNYSHYGHSLLAPASYAYHRCIPSPSYQLTNPNYYEAGNFVRHSMTPDLKKAMAFGDSGNGPSDNLNYIYHCAAHTRDPYMQKMLNDMRPVINTCFSKTPQWSVLFRDETVSALSGAGTPEHHFFYDLGMMTSRTGWEDPTGTSVAFKVGPMGGRILNETRGTEYSINTDYINVAHDDPDAGHFVLYNNGSFLSTGDDYENVDKVTSHFSTIQVDGATQYGGGGGWSQPKPVSQWSYDKDYAAGGEVVVLTGDMKGVYPNMDRLDRTMVSSNADYLVIFDQMESSSGGRTYDWRWAAPDEVTLTDKGGRTYEVANGNGKALVKMYEPSSGEWEPDTFSVSHKSGDVIYYYPRKLLHASFAGQQDQNFMVVIAPGKDDMTFVTANYNSGGTYGIKAAKDGNTEYVLFGTAGSISAGDVTASADVVATTGSATRLANAAMTNGTALAYNGTDYVSSTAKVNVGIDSLKADGTQALYRITAGSGAGGASATITLGGLVASTSMELSINGVAQSNVTTNGSGEADVSVSLDTVHVVALGGVEPFNSVRMPAVDGMPGLTIAPQPLVTGGQVSLHAATGMRVNAVLYNTDGSTAVTLYDGFLPAGNTGVKATVAAGMYLLNVNGYVSRVMVVK